MANGIVGAHSVTHSGRAVCGRSANYSAGEKGRVLDGPKTSSVNGTLYYVVAMDKDVAGRRTFFLADEIEAEVKAGKEPT